MINILCILCSLCIQFASVGITPYNMLPNNQSGVGDTQIDIVLDRIRNNYQGYWGDYRWVLNVPRESIVVVKGYTLWGNYNNEYTVLVPKEFNDPNVSSSISCNTYTLDEDNVVNSVSINFNQYVQFFTTMTYINNPYIDGYKSYQFDSANNWELVYCYVPVYCNGDQVIDIMDDVTIPTLPSLPGLGGFGSGGHSNGNNPFEELENVGNPFTNISGSLSAAGHSHSLPTISPSFDFSNNAEQNLLGQIVNNTFDISGHTSALHEDLKQINANIINGVSALFNAISGLNQNFVSSVVFDQEKCEEIWLNSNSHLAMVSVNGTYNLFESSIEDFVDDYSETEDIDELIIPIDLTVWELETEYGDFQPFDQIYYLRFGFLDETKAIWQPIFISLLYFCMFFSIYLDLPNIVRGATKS